MFGMGFGEIVIIVVVALLFLGPERLPQAAKSISKGIRDIRKQTRALRETIEDDNEIGDAVRELQSALRGDEQYNTMAARRRAALNRANAATDAESAVATAEAARGGATQSAAVAGATAAGADAEAAGADPSAPEAASASADADKPAADGPPTPVLASPAGSIARGDGGGDESASAGESASKSPAEQVHG
ncbi:Sec-independent protein translocase protein TatB [Haliangium ochraceum]|uniref:Sec-independent protein translocase protein TatB homolog n=1 Tax=Haliangium ochraceum (strain DSM 14365 / JCM 11303 / SMP-2) TaxID=502025 RepID=D0LGH1_HALO1|nr:Sec-independent protein translocase protein TatB [Haliangium ochraceum]ACY12717.1 twin-arginine translocation protein, TatB subunit [Haliangium ochraceum DSM 14365]